MNKPTQGHQPTGRKPTNPPGAEGPLREIFDDLIKDALISGRITANSARAALNYMHEMQRADCKAKTGSDAEITRCGEVKFQDTPHERKYQLASFMFDYLRLHNAIEDDGPAGKCVGPYLLKHCREHALDCSGELLGMIGPTPRDEQT